MIQSTSLAQRFGLLALAVPVLFMCLLGLVANWPVDCGPRGFGSDSLAGSRAYATLFGVGLTIGVAAAVAITVKRIKVGLVLLALSTVMAVFGIFL